MLKKKSKKIFFVCAIVLVMSFLALSPVAAQTGTVDVNTTYQTLEGFGAAIAWGHGTLTEHPYKIELYDLLFSGLGLDILRLRNQYRDDPDFDHESAEIVRMGTASLSRTLKVFISSWSPPATLKVNAVLNGGTLIKENNVFVYSKFADYWYNSLVAYAAKGIAPEYISIQNEPDYENSGWETCIFKPVEDATYPGYGTALNAVYNRVTGISPAPKFLASECTGIGSNLVQNYAAGMTMSQVYGVAHHLYNGGDANNPDTFITNMTPIANTYYGVKPIFQTEYDQGTAFTTAQLIYNSLVEEKVSSYFFWDLIWDTSQRPLIAIEDINNPSSWTSTHGYIISDFYYVFKQFTKYTDPGYKRVAVTSSSTDIKITGFTSADNKILTVILINKGSAQSTVSLTLTGFTPGSSAIYRTIPGGSEKFASAGSLGSGNSVVLPAQSVVTVVMAAAGSTIPTTQPPLPTLVPPPTSRSATTTIEAESYNSQYGCRSELISDTGARSMGYIEHYDYLVFSGVNFGTGVTGFKAKISSGTSGGNIEIRLGSTTGTLLGTCPVAGTGAWSTWADVTCAVTGATGSGNLYLLFTGSSGYLFNIDNFIFTGGTAGTATATTITRTATRTATSTATATTVTRTATATRTSTTLTRTATATRTSTTLTRTATATTVTRTATTTATTVTRTATATATSTGSGTGCSCAVGCSAITSITPNFSKDGAGQFAFSATSLGSYINSWNLTLLSVNGVAFTNTWVAKASLPALINGLYYVCYDSAVSWGHFEAMN